MMTTVTLSVFPFAFRQHSSAPSVAARRPPPSASVAFGAAFFALDLALTLVRRTDESPVDADGLTQQVAIIERLHRVTFEEAGTSIEVEMNVLDLAMIAEFV